MKVIVTKEFIDKDNINQVFLPQTIIDVEDPVRVNRMIGRGLVMQYSGEKNPIVFLPLSNLVRERRNRTLEKIMGNMIPIDGYDYPFAINRFQITQEDYCALLDITPDIMKEKEEYMMSSDIHPQYPFSTRHWMIKGKAAQSLERISPFINALGILTGQQFRLPTINEWEFVASNKGQSMDRECNCNSDLHIVGSSTPNELGIYDMLDNGLELCSIRMDSNPFYVGKGGTVRANKYEVWDLYSNPCISSSPVTIRLVLSSEHPVSTGECHPDLERRISEAIDGSYDRYSDMRDNWEN